MTFTTQSSNDGQLIWVYRVMDEQVRQTRRAHGRTILVEESTDKEDTIVEDNES
jgi:hypothetical protein